MQRTERLDSSRRTGSRHSVCRKDEDLYSSKAGADCAYPAISEVPFTATYEQSRISVTAVIPTLSVGYDSLGRCTVTSGQQRNEFKAVLTRP